MGSRRLARIALDPTDARQSEQLARRCDERGLHTCKQVFALGSFALRYELDLLPGEAERLLDAVSLDVAPRPTTALEIRRRVDLNTLPTGLELIDRKLLGGVPARSVTELVGAPGVGKTQFSMMVSVLALRQAASRAAPGERYGVAYIDTEAGFRSERALQMADSLFPVILGDARQQVASRLHYLHLTSTRALMSTLEQLESLIIEQGIRLVVLDSAAALARKEFGRETLAERQRMLGKQAAMLKQLAEDFAIPIIVTNQMTTYRTGVAPGTGEESNEQLAAALGNTWAHSVNTRLELCRDAEGPLPARPRRRVITGTRSLA
jgi:RAD51-like protein 1